MRASVVLRHDLDVLVAVASLKFVLDPEIGEMHRVIEVREVVLARPVFNFARVAIRPSITVRTVSIPLLEKALVLTLEVVLEDDAADVGPLPTQALFRAQMCAIELQIVRQLTRPVDAGVERLFAGVVAIASVRVEQLASAVGQRDGPLTSIEGHGSGQPLVAELAHVVITWVGRLVARVEQIAFGTRPGRRPPSRGRGSSRR